MKINHKNILWLLLLLLIIAASLFRYERFAGKRNFGDFHVYYVTGERMLAGRPIYVDDSEALTPYKYSPLVASFFALLSIFREPTAAGIWHVLNLLFLIGSIWICMSLIYVKKSLQPHHSQKQNVFLCVLAVLGVSPVILNCLNSGQVGLAILFLYLLSVYFSEKRHDMAGGFFLAFSAMFKYLPILILPYYIVHGRKKFVFWSAFWFLFFHFLSALWIGFSKNWNYLLGFLPFLTSTTLDQGSLLDFKNQSVWAYLYRLLYYEMGFFKAGGVDSKFLILIGAALFTAFYAIIVFSGKTRRKELLVIDKALLAILIAIFNPNAWKHNFVLLLFPYLILMLKYGRKGWWRQEFWVLLFTSFLIFLSNRDVLGWGLRFDLMSASILFLASMTLFSALIFYKQSSPAVHH